MQTQKKHPLHDYFDKQKSNVAFLKSVKQNFTQRGCFSCEGNDYIKFNRFNCVFPFLSGPKNVFVGFFFNLKREGENINLEHPLIFCGLKRSIACFLYPSLLRPEILILSMGITKSLAGYKNTISGWLINSAVRLILF